MNFSVYSDTYPSSDSSIIYSSDTIQDHSIGCTHSNYSFTVGINRPDGGNAYTQGPGLIGNTDIPVNGLVGNYSWYAETLYHCSCIQGTGGAGGGGGYTLLFADMNSFYAYLATLAGTTPSAIESRISALGLFSNPNGTLTSDNLNVINLGNAAFTNESAFTNAMSQMGFTDTAVPALPIPVGVLITISRTAAAELANALSTVGATAALIFVAVVVADGHAWQNDKEELCYEQYQGDMSTCEQRFPYPSSKGKYLACTGHAMTRYLLCMKGEPVPPLQPQY